MKTPLTIIIFLFAYFPIQAQNQAFYQAVKDSSDTYKIVEKKKRNKEDKKERSKVINDSLLDQNLNKALSYVIFSNSDIASNNSSFGYSQDKEKTNVSINGNFRLGKNKNVFARFGANASGSKSIFEFYGDGSWRNTVGANLGLIFKVWPGSAYFDSESKSFDELKKRRELFALDPYRNPIRYTTENLKSIEQLKKKLFELDEGTHTNYITLKAEFHQLMTVIPKLDSLLKKGMIEEAFTLLNKEEKEQVNYQKNVIDSPENVGKYIDSLFYEFDKKNDKSYGYNLTWVDINVNLSNGNYKFGEDNVDAAILDEFTNSRDDTENNVMKATLSANLNKTINKKNVVWFLQLGLSASSGSYLENSLIDGTPKVIEVENEGYFLQDESEQILGSYGDIDKRLKTGQLYGYGAIFITKEKNFGFNATLRHEYLIAQETDGIFRNNFTFLFGPLFRKIKDGETSLSFGIDVGWENAVYGTKVTKDFTGRIRLGIPFNIYSKKKDSPKK
ncbi:hypothetical protein [Flagellimonas sp.]|uniref:hypothetical protein n=1 Tax=Flagellimonas sp. TaxID=2058762 RepID=UPI003C7DA64C